MINTCCCFVKKKNKFNFSFFFKCEKHFGVDLIEREGVLFRFDMSQTYK